MKKEVYSHLEQYYSEINNLPGFMDFDMLNLFYNLQNINPSIDPVVEIGVFCGRSLAGLACAFYEARIIGVDPFFDDFGNSPAFADEADYLTTASQYLSPSERKSKLIETLKKIDAQFPDINLDKRVRLIEKTQEDFFSQHIGEQFFQLVHIDGEHTFKAIKDCLDRISEFLSNDAWIIVDDILNSGFPDISEAVHTHPDYRKRFWPVFYGFNKGVYIFNPRSLEYISQVKVDLLKKYEGSQFTVRHMHDGSLQVVRNESKRSNEKNFQKHNSLLRDLLKKIKSNFK